MDRYKESHEKLSVMEESHKQEQKRNSIALDEKQSTLRDMEDRLKEQEKEIRKMKKLEEQVLQLEQQLEEKKFYVIRRGQ